LEVSTNSFFDSFSNFVAVESFGFPMSRKVRRFSTAILGAPNFNT
jgi:hypothetical protein